MAMELERMKISLAILTLLITPGLTLPSVFVSRVEAHRSLHARVRRANSFLEELKLGDLERECLEETCSHEEAREIFSSPEQLEDFWRRYTVEDHCRSDPCQNGASCVSQTDTYICMCRPNFEGRHCDKELRPAGSYGCLYRNGGCEHFCVDGSGGGAHGCVCAPGYSLHTDNSSCTARDPFACGRPVPTGAGPRIVKGSVCPKGQCPWQALLAVDGVFKCGAVLLDAQWILTAAHCVWAKDPARLHVTVGEHIREQTEGTEQTRAVSSVLVHPLYNHSSADSDLALLRLRDRVSLGPYALPVCLPPAGGSFVRTLGSVRTSTVSGWGALAQAGPASPVLQRLEVPRISSDECRAKTGLKVTRNMLCAGFAEGVRDSCQGDSGGPLVTRYRNTWFLTGIVSWGKGCARAGTYGIYTRVSVFVEWIANTTAITA